MKKSNAADVTMKIDVNIDHINSTKDTDTDEEAFHDSRFNMAVDSSLVFILINLITRIKKKLYSAHLLICLRLYHWH